MLRSAPRKACQSAGLLPIALTIALLVGCSGKRDPEKSNASTTPRPSSSQTIAQAPKKEAADKPKSKNEQTTTTAANKKAVKPTPKETPPSEKERASTDAAKKSPATKGPKKPAISPGHDALRLLWLADANPIVLEVRVSLGERSLEAAYNELLAEVLRLADANRDGNPEWKELVESTAFRYGQFGNANLENEQARRQVMRNFDYNSDKRVNRNEAAAFIVNGRSAQGSFVLERARRPANGNEASTSLFRLIDMDGDGKLTPTEVDHASVALRRFDRNDDFLLTLSDFIQRSRFNRNRSMQIATVGGESLVLLGKDIEWGTVLVHLERQYAFGGTLEASSFAYTPTTFSELDVDKDKVIGADEVKRLATVPAHFTLAVSFPDLTTKDTKAGTQNASSEGTLRLIATHDDLRARDDCVATLRGGKVLFQVARERLSILLNDAARTTYSDAQLKDVFTGLDKDKNQYLEKKEVAARLPTFGVPLEAIDFDGDGRVYLPEMRRYARHRALRTQSQIVAQPGTASNPIFDLLDENADQRITERELAHVASRIRQLDSNGDEQIAMNEIPKTQQLTLSRGILGRQFQPIPAPRAQSATSANALPWFANMDRNGDGELSRREFLGTKTQFLELDGNEDGYISTQEAQTFATR